MNIQVRSCRFSLSQVSLTLALKRARLTDGCDRLLCLTLPPLVRRPQLANTEEIEDGKSNGALGEVFIRSVSLSPGDPVQPLAVASTS
jgi:hypothetical protein